VSRAYCPSFNFEPGRSYIGFNYELAIAAVRILVLLSDKRQFGALRMPRLPDCRRVGGGVDVVFVYQEKRYK
jgi:hypothetical protein